MLLSEKVNILLGLWLCLMCCVPRSRASTRKPYLSAHLFMDSSRAQAQEYQAAVDHGHVRDGAYTKHALHLGLQQQVTSVKQAATKAKPRQPSPRKARPTLQITAEDAAARAESVDQEGDSVRGNVVAIAAGTSGEQGNSEPGDRMTIGAAEGDLGCTASAAAGAPAFVVYIAAPTLPVGPQLQQFPLQQVCMLP
ncbi:hypothetical protein V7S43_007625 [Phytophthora oleae]|uniref:Uncharacterized protein n=1 Tax=Phytophthora oleae TaxID=2107226 RepID=A0ABD3FQV4_9STRA